MPCVQFKLRGRYLYTTSLLCQGATTTKHVYDFAAFHAFVQRLDPKLCRTGTSMG